MNNYKPEIYDLAIIGGGIIGISSGIAALESNPMLKVIIIEKSKKLGEHASGRNSGVLHAGFYYSPDSLKARYCKEGNLEIRAMAKKLGVEVNACGKVVVAKNELDAERLNILFERGIKNDVEIEKLSDKHLYSIEPQAQTVKHFIWSPTTSVLDPKSFLNELLKYFIKIGGKIIFDSSVNLTESGEEIHLEISGKVLNASKIINAGGANSDLLARSIGVGMKYEVIPFRGTYIKSKEKTKTKRLIYPVPHPINPFLGVHTTITPEGLLKIGPTAMVCFGRENYHGLRNLDLIESFRILNSLKLLAKGSSHNIVEMLKSEVPLLFQKKLIAEASKLCAEVPDVQTWHKIESGIRSQLVDKSTGELLQDFVVERYKNSLHFLNIVSPGWTSALPFTREFVLNFVNS